MSTTQVRPLLIQEVGQKYCLVTPQEKTSGGRAYTTPRLKLSGSRNLAGNEEFSVDSALKVFVTECVYPGGKDEAIKHKWIYAIRDRKIVAEAYAKSANEWLVSYDVNTGVQPHARPLKIATPGYFQLPRLEFNDKLGYGFFLSPVQLTPNGFTELLAHVKDHYSPIVTRPFATAVGTVSVPDPWRWARDAHALFYQPTLDHYQRWILNPENDAKLFIAGVLKRWMENGDPANVTDELEVGQPTDFVQRFEIERIVRSNAAEEAMAYVAGCVESPEHRVVEYSADEAGGDSFGYLCSHFGAITTRLSECRTGQELSLKMVEDKRRLPTKYLFSDLNRPTDYVFDFREGRFTWLGALATFEHLAQAVFDNRKNHAMQKMIQTEGIREVLQKFLHRLGVRTRIENAILNTAESREIWQKTYMGLSARRQERLAKRVLNADKEFLEEVAEAQELTGLSEKLLRIHEAMEPWVEHLKVTAGTMIEVINLYIALSELGEAEGGEKSKKIWAALAASGHAAEHLLDIVRTLAEKRLGRKFTGVALSRFEGGGGLLKVVTGACEMHEFLDEVQEDTLRGENGEAVGHAIAAAGAGAVAIGGGMTLAWAISAEVTGAASAGGPPGLLIAAIGDVLIIGGFLIAATLARNEFQHFASLCCFRKDKKIDVVQLPWASGNLGNDNPVIEAKVLRNLLSNFVVKRCDSILNNDTYLTVVTGHTPNGAKFDFWCNSINYPDEGYELPPRRFSVVLDEGLRIAESDDPQIRLGRVVFDGNHLLRSFELKIPSLGFVNGRHNVKNSGIAMSLDLDGKGCEVTPFGNHLLRLPADTLTQEYNSLDRKYWVEGDEPAQPKGSWNDRSYRNQRVAGVPTGLASDYSFAG